MINKETIISAYDEKLTLVQWLKLVNKALDEAVLTNVEIAQRGNATFVFVFTFEDGTQVESNEIIVNQGESIVGATIQNGHLLLTLSNDDVLDAGNVKPVSSFSINNSQHLIVHYGDGTTQDLGAIFQGNINIDGNFTANSIIENMDYENRFYITNTTDFTTKNNIYVSVVKTGNKITFVAFYSFKKNNLTGNKTTITWHLPVSVGEKLIPTLIGSRSVLNIDKITLFDENDQETQVLSTVVKQSDNYIQFNINVNNLTDDITYYARQEYTFLLSENLAS